MSCDLRQVTTIEVMEALNSLLRRQKGPDRKNIAFGEIAQTVADKHGVGPMVRSWSLLNRATASNCNIHSVTAYHAPNLCLLCFVRPDLFKPDFVEQLQLCRGATALPASVTFCDGE